MPLPSLEADQALASSTQPPTNHGFAANTFRIALAAGKVDLSPRYPDDVYKPPCIFLDLSL